MLSGIGKGIMDNPVGGLHLGKEALEMNPGMKMFGMTGMPGAGNDNLGWFENFKKSMSDQLMARAMQGFMGGG
jgi:hypothetical protein